MKKKKRSYAIFSVILLSAFVLWTAAVCLIDVRSIGPEGSSVGLASVNGPFHDLTGVHMSLYHLTDLLSAVPLICIGGFALTGAIQLVKRRHIKKVDRSILVLGGYYIVVMAVFILFQLAVVNYRPVLIDGVLEASYPSSTTMLVMCVMPVSASTLCEKLKSPVFRRIIRVLAMLFTAFMVTARLISGVHWLSDIVGGALFSAGMAAAFYRLNLTENND